MRCRTVYHLYKEDFVPLLEKALSDADMGVRLTALSMLKAMRGEKSLAVIRKALKDKDAHVRKAAAKSLRDRGY